MAFPVSENKKFEYVTCQGCSQLSFCYMGIFAYVGLVGDLLPKTQKILFCTSCDTNKVHTVNLIYKLLNPFVYMTSVSGVPFPKSMAYPFSDSLLFKIVGAVIMDTTGRFVSCFDATTLGLESTLVYTILASNRMAPQWLHNDTKNKTLISQIQSFESEAQSKR